MYPTQTCLRQHCGRRAKTTSSFWKGFSSFLEKTSPSSISSKKMWGALFFSNIIIFSLNFISWRTCLYNPWSFDQSVRFPKLSSPWRIWMQFFSQRKSLTLMDYRFHTCRRNAPGICLCIMKVDRWATCFISFFKFECVRLFREISFKDAVSIFDSFQVIVSLFNAIRATRLAYLHRKHPTLQTIDVRKFFARLNWRETVDFIHLMVLFVFLILHS